jgi:hypothetical protein
MLESDLQHELNISWLVRLGANLTERGWIVNVRRWCAELHPIKDIEEFSSKLHVELLADFRHVGTLDHGEVLVPERETPQAGFYTGPRPKGVGGRLTPGVDVQVQIAAGIE